jgi:hypothetical protein
MTPKSTGAWRLRAVAFSLLLIPVASCDNMKDTLLDAPIPTVIDPSAANSAAGADALRIGALSRLRSITAGAGSGDSPWMFAGLLTDEWKSSDTFSQRNETDQRSVQDNNANLTPVLRDLYRARTSAREAIVALTQYAPTPAANIGQMWLVMGTAEVYLAEWFCNGSPLGDASTGTPESTAPMTNAEVFALALAHFDSALATVTATDAFTTTIRNSAATMKGRVLMDLNRPTEAAAAVAGVPTNFRYSGTFSLTSGSNQIWSLGASAKRWTVGDSFDASGVIKNALPFASAKDPRVPVLGTTSGTSALGRGFDGATNLVSTTLWGRIDSTAIYSGIDARLIEAEAKLRANDITGMMAILNTLRAAPQPLGSLTMTSGFPSSTTLVPIVSSTAMAALPDPANTTDATTLLFREKAFWTFSRGMRLGDLRRLIRQYNRAEDVVFPSGTFHKGGVYGKDVNFPVTVDEQNNPQFTACLDRKA